jgi:hypothetical protein
MTSPPRRNYTDFLSHTNNDWNADEDDDDEYGYDNDDGDDFGLPSVASMKRKSKRATSEKLDTGGLSPWSHEPKENALGSRRLSNSADIAIERPPASYTSPKNSEGKILRPQYKEILRGRLEMCLRFANITKPEQILQTLYTLSIILLCQMMQHQKKLMVIAIELRG